MKIRREESKDFFAVYQIHAAAFPTNSEAKVVDLLRARGKARISLVAVENGELVGHILFSPVTVNQQEGLGLAPLAVLPSHQRKGVGALLCKAGLTMCEELGARFVVVLGDPTYYQRFRFENAKARGLQNEYGATEAFMVLEVCPGGLPVEGGLVKYAPEFSELGV